MARDDRNIKDTYVAALLELCKTKPLKKITVGDVLGEAGTARQTFYNHFRDINDLIAYVHISFLEEHHPPFCPPDVSEATFRFMLEHKEFYRQLPSHDGQNCFRDSYLSWLKESYYRVAFEGIPPESEEYLRRKALVDAYLYGNVDLFMEWCRSGLEWPIEGLMAVIYETSPDFILDAMTPDFEAPRSETAPD